MNRSEIERLAAEAKPAPPPGAQVAGQAWAPTDEDLAHFIDKLREGGVKVTVQRVEAAPVDDLGVTS